MYIVPHSISLVNLLRQELLFRAEKAARNRKFTFRTRKILEISAFCVILKLTRTGGFVPQAPAATRPRRGSTPPTATKRHAFPPAACLPVHGAHDIRSDKTGFMKEDSTMTFGDKLSALRREQNYTQEQLADLLGVSRQSVSKWESGVSQS